MRVVPAWLVALLLGACSCAGSSDATQKELADIRSELVKLRAQNAILSDRLDSVEAAARPAPVARPAPPQEDPDRPVLQVVRLAPDAPAGTPKEAQAHSSPPRGRGGAQAEPPADGSAGGSRPVIRLTGKPAAAAQPSQNKTLKPNAHP